MCKYVYVYMYVRVCVCVCMCVRMFARVYVWVLAAMDNNTH